MWQRFTENARQVVLLAQEGAGQARSVGVDSEHLLLALFFQNEERVAHLFTSMDVNALEVRAEAASAVAHSPKKSADEEPKLTPSAKRVLELAADEARRAGHNYIGTEHLLLALVRQTQGAAFQILLTQGADLEKARAAVIREVGWGEQKASYRVTPLSGIEFEQNIADVLGMARHWANLSQGSIGAEELLLSLLERRADLSVEILGLDVLALKKARLKLALRLDLFEEAANLRDEIVRDETESEQS